MSAQLERLIVDVELETAELRKGVSNSIEQLEKLGELIKGITGFEAFKKLGEFALEAGEKLADFVVDGAEAADKMGKLAAAAQVPVETFERLSYAAKLGGLSAEDLGGAFNKLNKALGEAALGGKTQTALFQALGVSLKDANGVARGSADIFRELAGKLNELAPGYAKSTLEQELFGKSGAHLDETLKNVAEGMADVGGEADKLGLVLSEGAVKAATEFHDNLERLKMAGEGIAANVAGQLAPAFNTLTDELFKSAAAGDVFRGTADLIADGIRVLASAVVLAVGKIREMGTELAGIAAIGANLATGDFAGAAEVWDAQEEELAKISQQTASQLTTIWAKNGETFDKGADAHKKMADGILADQKRIEDGAKVMEARLREAIALATKLTNEHFAETDTAHKSSSTTEHGVQTQAAFDNIGKSVIDMAKDVTAGFSDFADANEQYTQAQIGINNEQAAAAEAKKNLDVEGYDFATQALESQEEIARRAKAAMEGFKDLKTEELKKAAEAVKGFTNSVLQATATVLKKLGDLGDVAGAAMQGFQSGGIWGAIIAALAELLTKFSRFGELVAQGNDIVQNLLGALGPGLGALVDGLKSFMYGIGQVLNVVGSLLNGPLRGVAIMFDHLGTTLSGLWEGIGPAMDAIGSIVDVIMSLIQVLDPMKPVITLLSAIFKVVGIVILELSRGIMIFVGWVIDAIRNFLLSLPQTKELSQMENTLSALIFKINAGADNAGNQVDLMWTSLGHAFDDPFGIDKQQTINNVGDKDTGLGPSAAATVPIDELGKSAGKTAKAMDKLTEQFTNLPEGFKVRLRTLQATDAVGPLHHQQGGDIHVHAQGVFLSMAQLLEQIAAAQGTQKWRQQGFKG